MAPISWLLAYLSRFNFACSLALILLPKIVISECRIVSWSYGMQIKISLDLNNIFMSQKSNQPKNMYFKPVCSAENIKLPTQTPNSKQIHYSNVPIIVVGIIPLTLSHFAAKAKFKCLASANWQSLNLASTTASDETSILLLSAQCIQFFFGRNKLSAKIGRYFPSFLLSIKISAYTSFYLIILIPELQRQLMSVFIKVKEAQFQESENAHEASLKIKSRDTELVVSPIPFVNKIIWNCSLISSIKEQKLQFKLTFIYQNQANNYTLSNWLSFSPLHFRAQMETKETLVFNQNIRLHLDIFYTKKKNFLGPIQFYENENASSDSILLLHHDQNRAQTTKNQIKASLSQDLHQTKAQARKQVVKTKGLFFCCGQDFQDKYEIEDQDDPKRRIQEKRSQLGHQLRNAKPQVQLQQGACESKQLFSYCDVGLADKKFALVEDNCRDLPLQ